MFDRVQNTPLYYVKNVGEMAIWEWRILRIMLHEIFSFWNLTSNSSSKKRS